jgi:hypothetical protein
MRDLKAWLEVRVEPLLCAAESLFGPREPGWVFKGISFTSDGPNTFFPLGGPFVSIQLSQSAEGDWERALYQLAHEVVHLLAPHVPPPSTILLEEGVAVWFSLQAPGLPRHYRRKAKRHIETKPESKSYCDALGLFNSLVAIEPSAITTLREAQPRFFEMTAGFIVDRLPSVPRELAERLCERRIMR